MPDTTGPEVAEPTAPVAGGPATVPSFDQVTVAVAPGDDLVVRLPGMVLVVAVQAAGQQVPPPSRFAGWSVTPAAAPSRADVSPDLVGELLDLCWEVSARGRRAPGRRLHEDLGSWLASLDQMPSLAVAAATEAGLAVVVSGSGMVEVPDLGLRLGADDGDPLRPGPGHLERLVDWPPAPLRLSVRASSIAVHPRADLEAGIVPGSAAVLTSASANPTPGGAGPATRTIRLPGPGLGAPAVPGGPRPRDPAVRVDQHGVVAPAPEDDRGTPVQQSPSDGRPAVGSPGGAPVRSSSLLDDDLPEEPPRPPLPVVSVEGQAESTDAPDDDRPRVEGFLCSRGHLNDPRVHFCALCGIRMAERTGVFTDGIRPPLGLLVFDNGAAVSLEADYLLGREPETDERVRAGQLVPLPIADQTGGVSRHHAEIRLQDWDVVLVDNGSSNGTLVAARDAAVWSALVPDAPIRLTPGMTVRMGGRQFVFESPHGEP